MTATARIHKEITALRDMFDSIDYNPADGTVIVRDYRFPEAWTPETGDIMLDLPEIYPQVSPRVYVPDDLRLHGEIPPIICRAAPDGWSRFDNRCQQWVPDRHTVITVLRWLDAEFRRNASDDP